MVHVLTAPAGSPPPSVCAPRGFRAAGVRAGIKPSGNPDLAIIVSDQPTTAAAVYTTNQVCAAPVRVSRARTSRGLGQAVVVNAGCANACTGPEGEANAERMAELAAQALGIPSDRVLVASTGVIGRQLPMEKVAAGIAAASAALSAAGDADAARAIMTTDTRPKEIAVEFAASSGTVRIGGICKGSGMIAPNMATMLAFLTTDAAVSPNLLQATLESVVQRTFNCVTVDGDTSTNDMLAILANGASGVTIEPATPDAQAFEQALESVCVHLSRCLASDGEGATKLVEIRVTGALTAEDARRVALSIGNSPLVKTALFGNDPNWGRILCAAGYSGVSLDESRLQLEVAGFQLVDAGTPLPFEEAAVSQAMKTAELEIHLHLGAGDAAARVWTCDFSYDYVRINAEYTT